jgi:hypothetical protein
MAFAQFTYRESLRDIEHCLNAHRSKLFNLGFRGNITRSTLAYANNTRDWRIYADFASVLIAIAKDLYRDEPFAVDIAVTVYALDCQGPEQFPMSMSIRASLFPREQGQSIPHRLIPLRQLPLQSDFGL